MIIITKNILEYFKKLNVTVKKGPPFFTVLSEIEGLRLFVVI